LPECSPDFFYFTLRPYLEGTGDLESVGLPDGILYETTIGGVLQKYRGPSNAQSSLFAFIDIALGVKHYGEDVLSSLRTDNVEDAKLLRSKERFLKVRNDFWG
jgi:indoleamine 2,3-dioxygenase